jgi:hypothetical protein
MHSVGPLTAAAARVAELIPLLDSLRIDDAALAELFATPSRDPWHSIELVDRPDAHATLFGLRAGATIPLHDHPDMTVVCKVLQGQMRVRTLSLSETDIAWDRGSVDISPEDPPLILRNTLHEITAVTDCVFLDLFSPWYDDDARPCTYWRIAAERDGVVTLERAEKP